MTGSTVRSSLPRARFITAQSSPIPAGVGGVALPSHARISRIRAPSPTEETDPRAGEEKRPPCAHEPTPTRMRIVMFRLKRAWATIVVPIVPVRS